MNFKIINYTSQSKSDLLGAFISGLCLIHCLATPFLFVAQAGLTHHHTKGPWWWGTIDIVLLILSFAAIYWSVKHTSKPWVKYLFVISWLSLSFIIFNEKLEIAHFPEEIIYIPTLSLIILHLYNRKYCQCTDDQCCAEPKK
ncbi:MAG: MerC domain-containing protein [Thermonemataceae bacterium]